MSDFERFVDGRGRMAALLRALPPFEVPAGMEARFLAALPAAPATDGSFEAPASLTESVLAEAARIDAAQATRREAALRELGRGSAEALLGMAPAAGTEAWLARQAASVRAAKPHAWTRRRAWFPGLGGALAASLALGVALQVMREPPPEPHAEAGPRVQQEMSAPTGAAQDASLAAAPADAAPLPAAPPVATAPAVAERARQARPSAGHSDAAPPKAEAPKRVAAPPAPASPDAALSTAPAAAMRFEPRRPAPGPAAGVAAAEPPAAQKSLHAPAATEALAETRAPPARALADSAAAPRIRLRFRLDAAASAVAGQLLEAGHEGARWRAQANARDLHAAGELIRELRQRGVSIELDIGEGPPGELIVERRP